MLPSMSDGFDGQLPRPALAIIFQLRLMSAHFC